MRFDRHIAAKFEAKGFPNSTLIVDGNLREIMGKYAEWLAKATLNTRIIMTLAKTKAELGDSSDDMLALFDEAVGQLEGSEADGH